MKNYFIKPTFEHIIVNKIYYNSEFVNKDFYNVVRNLLTDLTNNEIKHNSVSKHYRVTNKKSDDKNYDMMYVIEEIKQTGFLAIPEKQ